MNNSLRPETNTRDTEKCSFCRQRRKKCSPHGRDWENSQQKCDYCQTHNLPCGPNVKYREDPAVVRRRAAIPGNANAAGSNQARERHYEGLTAQSAPNIPPPTAHCEGEIHGGPPIASRAEDGGEPGTPSIEDIQRKAFSKLHDFHALGNTLAYISQPAFIYCHDNGARQTYHDLSIEEKLHDLFINIYGTAVEANAQNESHVARWILFALVFALDQYPQLFDNRKRHILLKVALMFQELGHRWECEHVLLKIAGMFKMTALPSQEGPFHLLANSLPTSSISTKRVLVDRWNETVGGSLVDSNLNVPPLHAAVQHRNPSIIWALLSNSNNCTPLPLTPSLTTSSTVGQVIANIDERDLNSRTALFAAVAIGEESCCLALLLNGADANTRDDHGHTALEVAVRGGHFSIVKTLIEHKADVNPNIMGCSSLPLHAAIESNNLQLEIIHHLLNRGAEVNLRRLVDDKHAIDLAVDREYHELAESMRRMIPSPNNTPFILRDFSMGQIIY